MDDPVSPALILASASPRRQQLLATLGLAFTVDPADVDETPGPGEAAGAYAARLALEKARAVAKRRGAGLVLGADTTVVLDGQILGKPADAAEAEAMLRALRGRRHEVITALALVDAASDRSWTGLERTTVWMRDYSTTELEAYVASGEPLDKAGAYAIQDPGFRPVARIEGSTSNVIGLPLALTAALLRAAGLHPRAAPPEPREPGPPAGAAPAPPHPPG